MTGWTVTITMFLICSESPSSSEGGTESGEFIHSGREDHHGAFIEDDIQFKTRIVSRTVVSCRCEVRDNDLSHAQRSNAAFTQFVDK